MKKVLLFSLLMLVTACGDKVYLKDITDASDICDKNGGTEYLRLSTQPGAYMYVIVVSCKDGARFEDSTMWSNKK